jgi:glycosyltransferase involved in cell wall biosynthesis
MRIALFSGNYNYVREGANQALNRLVGHLEAAGHKVRVYSPVTATPAFEPTGTLIAVPSVTLPLRSEFQLALGISKTVGRDIARFAPEIIHVSTPDILGLRAQAFARRIGIPIVASLHTRFETYVDYYGLGWTRPLIEAHLHRFYRRADHVLVPTPALRQDMLTVRGVDRVTVWSRGIDRALFSPGQRDVAWRRANGWNDDDVVILFFGRLVLEKGVDIFIATIRRLQAQGLRIRSLIVGAGPAASKFAALPDAVLTGHLDGADLARAVASADILLTPSVTETFGNVVLEAMASGLAIVSADVDSARALIEPDITGTLCPATNVEEFASAVAALVADPGRRHRLGRAARQASAAYSWDAASRCVEQAYVDTLDDIASRQNGQTRTRRQSSAGAL